MTDVPTFDWMPPDEAAQLLIACCGARRWVDGMIVRRPFGDIRSLLAAADELWRAMGPADWREAFAHHPRLGESRSAAPQDDRARLWSSGEQAGARNTDASMRAELAGANAAYEERFGFICIICATGLHAEDILQLTRERLKNDPEHELQVAAEEQRMITRLRLLKLFNAPDKAATA
jgi:OHCU decarboxylase